MRDYGSIFNMGPGISSFSAQALAEIKARCFRQMLSMYKSANAGHIGSGLSCLEILVYLYCYRMAPEDVCILSKGHAAAALYTVLAECGRLPAAELETYYKDGTSLAAHPPCHRGIADIPFGTGSLGHGLSVATGIAYAARYKKEAKQVYCVVSDGDCNEGSTWEAFWFAAHHQLDNLTIIVDQNGLQGLGTTEEVLNYGPMAPKLESANIHVGTALNGNNFGSLHVTFEGLTDKKGPKCIIANTTKGAGVSYMENEMKWHYLPMNDAQYQEAMNTLEG